MEIGSYRGFAMRLEYRAMEQAFVVGLRGAAVYFAELGTDVQGNLARINNALNGMEAHLKKLTQEISEIEKQQENTRQELEKPFAQEQELAEKEARLSAVNALLNIDGKNSIPDLMDEMCIRDRYRGRGPYGHGGGTGHIGAVCGMGRPCGRL